ncbi:hypothetical protein [Natronobacterium gregoryi]|uniref:Uncharacterized protein n=2 Tax=Natronobacterium gregoryi TaxID=44930 RepID=L0ACB9_NATGS|nr:hypothetical protein [Natronobacterium gregoryi]AFZ71511.1 hypothetical protein Natgr_0251 [Natronobacterium gregoryi SP2]ELY66567.1 hypothetical protein C490_12382 [Natronobacterium gregoryi SP2]PLK21285.1 hypothetical protein CYV19_04390 [Natronobacterium gregoryi SP2]SFI83083.1 hypothetical protein SAMN05443661_106131 [Natronobacterium gregoryi]
MKTLEITDEQYALIQQVREELSEEVVGRYGHVRDRDAIQFLIDNVGTDGDGGVSIDAGIDGEIDASEFTYNVETDDADETESDDDRDDGGSEADDDEMLDEMMSLLETHDDKWNESSSEDARYEVELPDGSTEEAQTKDDVRALLFKNYR